MGQPAASLLTDGASSPWLGLPLLLSHPRRAAGGWLFILKPIVKLPRAPPLLATPWALGTAPQLCHPLPPLHLPGSCDA